MTEREKNIVATSNDTDDGSKNSLVQTLVNNFRNAFNSHDPKVFSSLLVEDAEWTDVIGTTTVGKKEIEDLHIYPFKTVLKDATLVVKSFRNKWINDSVVSIEIKWESFGHKTPEGIPIQNIRYGLLNLIATITETQGEGSSPTLKIISAHNNDYTSTFTQSDRKKVVDNFKHSERGSSKLPVVERIYETHLTVSNLERSISFYRDVLGLEFGIKDVEHNCAFLFAGGHKQSMLGLWSTNMAPIGLKLHIAFKVNINDLFNIPSTLRLKGIIPLNIYEEETDDPTVIPFIPSASVYFRDPDGHLLEYLALLDEEPRPNLEIVPWSEWIQKKDKT
ncbi:MAG: VOC family protein [Candidatus Nitrosocosmicus sp.]|nr:VOC family protein [Candidatus Nitrosocosmicus sp.]